MPCPDFDDGSTDNSNITVLPPHLFAQAFTVADDHLAMPGKAEKKYRLDLGYSQT